MLYTDILALRQFQFNARDSRIHRPPMREGFFPPEGKDPFRRQRRQQDAESADCATASNTASSIPRQNGQPLLHGPRIDTCPKTPRCKHRTEFVQPSVEEGRFHGWACSECAWVFNASDPPIGKSFGSIHTVPVNSAASKETCTQRHYSVAELAEAWKLSENTIRRMFEHEPGVLKWGTTESRYKRRYTTLRIPETVVLRVHRQIRAAG